MAWKFAIAVLSALALSTPAFATEMMNSAGHHACASGGKKVAVWSTTPRATMRVRPVTRRAAA